MIRPPSDYQLARQRAEASLGRTTRRVLCIQHESLVGEIRDSSEGWVFCAEVPLEPGIGAEEYLNHLREETGAEPPWPVHVVRYLIERTAEPDDPPRAWCEGDGGHLLTLHRLEFLTAWGPHWLSWAPNDRIRIEPAD